MFVGSEGVRATEMFACLLWCVSRKKSVKEMIQLIKGTGETEKGDGDVCVCVL